MKKLLLTAIIAVSLISSSFAKGTSATVNYKVKSSFNYDFKEAQNVQWSSTDAYVSASFVLDQKGAKAFYSHDGDLIGVSSAVTMDQLPAHAKRTFAKKYSGYTVTETIRFDKQEGSAYYISAENENEKLVLQVENGQVTRYKN